MLCPTVAVRRHAHHEAAERRCLGRSCRRNGVDWGRRSRPERGRGRPSGDVDSGGHGGRGRPPSGPELAGPAAGSVGGRGAGGARGGWSWSWIRWQRRGQPAAGRPCTRSVAAALLHGGLARVAGEEGRDMRWACRRRAHVLSICAGMQSSVKLTEESPHPPHPRTHTTTTAIPRWVHCPRLTSLRCRAPMPACARPGTPPVCATLLPAPCCYSMLC